MKIENWEFVYFDEGVPLLAIVQYGLFQEVGCDLQLALRRVVAAVLHHAVQHQDAPQHGVGEVVEFAAEVNHIVFLC